MDFYQTILIDGQNVPLYAVIISFVFLGNLIGSLSTIFFNILFDNYIIKKRNQKN